MTSRQMNDLYRKFNIPEYLSTFVTNCKWLRGTKVHRPMDVVK